MNNILNNNSLLTYEEAGVILTISARSVERLVNAGSLKSVRVTKAATRIRYPDLTEWIAALTPVPRGSTLHENAIEDAG